MSNIKINAQYIKDLSFEVPNSPEVFLTPTLKPDIALSVNIDAKKLSVNSFEVTLKMDAKATGNAKVIFICDLSYSGVFTLDEGLTNEQDIEQILLIYCPNILFPYVRRIISSATIDGGFPPLMLEPIDFADLYQKRVAQKKDND
ncbi:MAG: preprotein translocase subunit SecB [Rickettsiales bacterium]|jgi:preprotein translocase subunit SecB